MIYVPLRLEMVCLCQKRTMYLSVMFSLNGFTKQTMQGDVQCISCLL